MPASPGSSTNGPPAAAAAGPTSSSASGKDAGTGLSTTTCSSTGTRRHVRALLIAFANGREYGIGARIAPGAELDDGLLDTAIVEECRVMARFWHARHLAMGTVHLAPNVTTLRLTHAIIERDGPMEFHVDGEPGVAEGRIEVRILPSVLRVRTRAVSSAPSS